MKQKPDEPLDQWVRQNLEKLPDTLPTGSAFDAERLWEQLRPELPGVPIRRQLRPVWWMAAACLGGWLVVGLWPDQNPIERHRVARGQVLIPTARPNDVPSASATIQKQQLLKQVQSAESTHQVVVRGPQATAEENGWRRFSNERLASQPNELPPPVKSITELPVEAVSNPVGTTEGGPLLATIVAAVSPKRHFRVVHLNELQAEEESRPKLYRTESFVRLGIGKVESPAPADASPTLVFPLTTKSIP